MEIFGYRFKNAALLEEALTTPSCRQQNAAIHDNQRLEFLGDAVLGLLAAEKLYAECPDEPEGRLTVRRTHMVSSAALCKAAERNGLVKRMKFAHGVQLPPPHAKVYADAIEAIIGAVWLDGGFEATRGVFGYLALAESAENGEWSVNPKGDLQLYTQSLTPPERPVYELLSRKGEAHCPVFTVRCRVSGLGEAVASASNRKEAETIAAAKLLKNIPAGTGKSVT